VGIEQVRNHLAGLYPRVDPVSVLPAIRGDLDTVKGETDELDRLITDMFLTGPLSYVTIELEDPVQRRPTIIKVFKFTHGLDIERGVIPSSLIDDLIEAKFGYRPRFLGRRDSLNTILGWQSQGLWRAGVQLFAGDKPKAAEVEQAIAFADMFAKLVSSVTERDIWRLKSKLGRFSEEKLVSIVSNLQAHTFEDRVADFLRRKHGYTAVETRYKPPYLEGKEVDVYATRSSGHGSTEMTICECKLVIGNREISKDEVDVFRSVATRVAEVESAKAHQRGETTSIRCWFVTNTHRVPQIPTTEIRLMVAKLPQNWLVMDYWAISEIEPA
jgi:hypothetical protein